MRVNEIKIGMLAKSKAGHDKNHIYVICEVDQTYVYLVDGKTKSLTKPKKKKIKHVQIICETHEIDKLDDVGIKRILKMFDKESGRK